MTNLNIGTERFGDSTWKRLHLPVNYYNKITYDYTISHMLNCYSY